MDNDNDDTESFPSVLSPQSQATEPVYEDELDEEFAPRPKAKLGAATIALAALLLAGLGFIVGVYVQKHDGPTSNTNTAAAAFANRARAGGFTGEGGGGFGGGAPAGGGAAGGAGGGTGGGTGGTSATTPAVIGTVVSVNGNTMVVKNFAGKEITVTLSGDTSVTKAATAADLTAGQSVTVSGATGTDGSVTASSVVAR